MNEKRFEISRDKYFIFDNVEDDFLDLEDVVNKLNAFEEEIKEFKKVRINDLKDFSALDKQNCDLKKENEQLRQELQGMKELLKSYRKTIKHDAELLADATKNGYLPPLDDFKMVISDE